MEWCKKVLKFRRLMAAVITSAMIFLTGAASAGQNDSRLDAMFNRLHELDDSREAQKIELAIWQVWSKSGSDTADLLLARGGRAMTDQNFDLAMEVFTALIALEPEFAEGWNKRATLHFMMGNFEASISDIERTLELAPRHFGALSGLGQIYTIMERPKDAIEAYRRGLAANPFMRGARAIIEALRKQIGERDI
jgi:tetratricopeptide (TPR) repeat protein